MSPMVIGLLWFLAIMMAYFAIFRRDTSEERDPLLKVLPSASIGGAYYNVLEERAFNNRYNPFYRKHIQKRMKGRLASYLIENVFGKRAQSLLERLQQSGMSDKISMEELMSIKVIAFVAALGALLLMLVTGSSLFFIFVLAGMYVSFMGVEFSLARKVKRRQFQMQKELPEFLTLLKSVMDTGVSIQRGVELMTAKYPGMLSEEFHKAMVEAQANGGDWRMALENMALRNNVEELSMVISDILLAYQRGTPIGEVLGRQAREMREIYTTSIEEKARSLSVKLLIPLVLFSFGPLFVMIVAPMAVKFMQEFH